MPFISQAAYQFVLTLAVADCNDNPPMFSTLDYSVTIDERTSTSSSPVTIFSGISTTDNDATNDNKAVTYSLVDGPSSTLNWLDINQNTVSCMACSNWVNNGQLVYT